MTNPRSGSFARVPARAVEDQRIGNAAFRVLACLGTYANKDGWCHPNTKTVCERLQLARPTVVGHIKFLDELGYIETHTTLRNDGGAGPNKYRLLFDELPVEITDEPVNKPDSGDTPLSGSPTPPCRVLPCTPVGFCRTTPYRNR